MSSQYMGMGKETYDLLYTDVNGNSVDWDDLTHCEDEDIIVERIKPMHLLLKRIENITNDSEEYSKFIAPVESARLLSSWGDDKGLSYLEYLVDNRIDKFSNLSPHRIHGYDQTYEEILESVIGYYLRYADRSDKEGLQAAHKIESIVKKIIILSNELPFDISRSFSWIKEENWRVYEPELKESFVKAVKADEDQWKIKDLKELLINWDVGFVNETLQKYSANLA
jgi:hypothetical protein